MLVMKKWRKEKVIFGTEETLEESRRYNLNTILKYCE